MSNLPQTDKVSEEVWYISEGKHFALLKKSNFWGQREGEMKGQMRRNFHC